MDVKFGLKFQQHMLNFPKQDRLKLTQFITHIENYGFDGLKGRNKSSDEVPTDDPSWLAKVKYAQKYNLWHFHIGIPHYTTSPKGDLTSEYVLHYLLEADFIVLVDMSPHPPLNLPDESYLVY